MNFYYYAVERVSPAHEGTLKTPTIRLAQRSMLHSGGIAAALFLIFTTSFANLIKGWPFAFPGRWPHPDLSHRESLSCMSDKTKDVGGFQRLVSVINRRY